MRYLPFIFLLLMTILLYKFGPSDGQINYKTGEIRYRFCYVPYRFTEMGKYQSEWEKIGLKNEWGTVVRYPLKSTNNTDSMIRNFCSGIAIWSKYDTGLAKIFADDLVGYIESTSCESGLPKYSLLYSPFYLNFTKGSIRNDNKDLNDELSEFSDPVKNKIHEIIKKENG